MIPGWDREASFVHVYVKNEKRIYPRGDGFAISDHHTWLPGIYETFDAAALAFMIPDDGGLHQLNEEAKIPAESEDDTPDYRPITFDKVQSIIKKYYS